MAFPIQALETARIVAAPDGSAVRILVSAPTGSMAHFRLPPFAVSRAMAHRTVHEVWFILAGQGQMWRSDGTGDEVTALVPGLSLAIAPGTSFQFRCDAAEPLDAVAVTMPPWPGDNEAYAVDGIWPPTI